MNILEEIVRLSEEDLTLGKDEYGKRIAENQTNAIRIIQDYWSKYVKNKEMLKQTRFNIGPLRTAFKIVRSLNNPKLAKYEKMAAKMLGEYDNYRKNNISDAEKR